MVPVIGLTSFDDHKNNSTYISINSNYTYSVSAAGGLPVVLPGPSGLSAENGSTEATTESRLAAKAEAYTQKLDGLVLTGGGDVCPYFYGEQTHKSIGRFDSNRDRWEMALFTAAKARKIPVLAICRGCQVVNVALGGTLWQDIPSQLPDAYGHSFDVGVDELAHYIDLVPGTRLHGMFKETRILVNSFHHQSIKDIAPGLIVSASTGDGIIEAVEYTNPEVFMLALQFHPECLTRRYPEFLVPFNALTEAAYNYRNQHG